MSTLIAYVIQTPLPVLCIAAQVSLTHPSAAALSVDDSEAYSADNNDNDSDIASDADSEAGGDDELDWSPQPGPAPPVPPDCHALSKGVLNADVREVFHRLLADEVRTFSFPQISCFVNQLRWLSYRTVSHSNGFASQNWLICMYGNVLDCRPRALHPLHVSLHHRRCCASSV